MKITYPETWKSSNFKTRNVSTLHSSVHKCAQTAVAMNVSSTEVYVLRVWGLHVLLRNVERYMLISRFSTFPPSDLCTITSLLWEWLWELLWEWLWEILWLAHRMTLRMALGGERSWDSIRFKTRVRWLSSWHKLFGDISCPCDAHIYVLLCTNRWTQTLPRRYSAPRFYQIAIKSSKSKRQPSISPELVYLKRILPSCLRRGRSRRQTQ